MIPKTVHCRLTAPEPIRRHLWHLMTERNTPLINALLEEVSEHPSFEDWQRKGSISTTDVKVLCNKLKGIYPDQPDRVYASATLMVSYVYKSWLALQKSRRHRLDRAQRWLNIIKSDAELCELSASPLTDIRHRAQDILNRLNTACEAQPSQSEAPSNKKKQKRRKADSSGGKNLMSRLFEMYDATSDTLDRYAIAYLIKNRGKVPTKEEDQEKLAHRILSKQEEIGNLEVQLQARLPEGRDLKGEEFLETLSEVTHQIPETVAQTRAWQAKLLAKPALLPYPLRYDSAGDVYWGKTAKGRISVNFNGLEKYFKDADPNIKKWFKTHKECPFQVYCDQRQLPYFQRFLEDWGDRKKQENYPDGVLRLSSAILGWREGEGKGEPWNVHHLVLYCSFDVRLMTAEGTLEVQQEKIAKILKTLERRPDADPRKRTTLDRLQNYSSVRPSQKPYQGDPEILVGLSISLANPITAVVVNGRTGKILARRTPRSLLGKQYYLLHLRRQKQQQNTLTRHENQKKGIPYQPSESELGQYVDRLLAKRVIQFAQSYRAGSIVIPDLTHIRDLLASEIQARAEQKCPGSEKAQEKYAKQYQMRIHRWSYNRLIKAIRGKARQLGIPIESGFQLASNDPQKQAKDIAIAAYHTRATIQKS